MHSEIMNLRCFIDDSHVFATQLKWSLAAKDTMLGGADGVTLSGGQARISKKHFTVPVRYICRFLSKGFIHDQKFTWDAK